MWEGTPNISFSCWTILIRLWSLSFKTFYWIEKTTWNQQEKKLFWQGSQISKPYFAAASTWPASFPISYFSQDFSLLGLLKQSSLTHLIYYFHFQNQRNWYTRLWYSTYSYNVQWCGSFNRCQEWSGSLLQNGWAPRL